VQTQREHDDSELEDGADAEPSLGSFDRMADQSRAWLSPGEIDIEQDDYDDETECEDEGAQCEDEGAGF